MRDLIPDVRASVRLIRRQPAFSAAIVLTLALGITAMAVIFSALDALVLRVMDLPEPDRLVVVSEATPGSSPEDQVAAPANFLDWRASAATFDYMGAYDRNDANLAVPGAETTSERVAVTSMSASLLTVLGATPQAGRLIDAGDEARGGPRVAVLSDGLWRRRFGADPGVVGHSLLLDEVPHTIVGVASRDFTFPQGSGVWTALVFSPDQARERSREYLTVIGRLADGETLASARAELATLSARLQQAHPESNASVTAVAVPMRAAIRDEGAPAMIAAWQAGATLVLLIACVNVAQMLLARGTARRREFTVRAALGASLSRLVRLLVTEGLVLSALAGAASIGLSWLALKVMKASMPEELTRFVYGWQWLGVNGRLLAFIVVISLVTAVVFSLLPALHAARLDLNDTLRQGGRGAAPASGWRQNGLVVIEIALALILTTATALSVKGASGLLFGHPGYEERRVLSATVSLPPASYPSPESRRQFYDRALERLARVPGLESSAIVNVVPSGLYNTSRPVVREGTVPRDPSDLPRADYRVISAGYFSTMAIPIVAGRAIEVTDGPDAPPVAVVSTSFAARFWPGLDPLGRRFRIGLDGPWITVVGVSGDVIHHWFSRRRYPTMFVPFGQEPRAISGFVVKTQGDPLSAAASVRAALAGIDPHLPLFNVHSLERLREINLTGLNYLVAIMSILGAIAAVLAAVGTYAVMTASVTRRRREIGVRVALGAAPSAIARLAGSQVARLTAAGLLLGIGGALAVGKLLASVLFGIVSLDAWTIAVATAGLGAVAMVAGLLPVRRALAIDPVTTLREE